MLVRRDVRSGNQTKDHYVTHLITGTSKNCDIIKAETVPRARSPNERAKTDTLSTAGC